jgi:predicted N-formylglutamate amidohydrolase
MDGHTELTDTNATLLGPNDPPAYEQINTDGSAHLVLICDHAGRAVPHALGGLGVGEAEMDRHIAYDIGARAVTQRLSELLDATAILHNYSRLVIDCNRPLGHPESIGDVSDGTPIPGNERLSEPLALQRIDALFWPYHQAISTEIGHRWRTEGVPPVLFSVHSFTPNFGEQARPWDAGVLYSRDPRIGAPMMEILREHGLNIGDNEPYSGLEAAYTIDAHGTSPGIANGVIEIRQDQVADEEGQERWAQILADAMLQIIRRDNMYSVQRF